MLQVHRHCVNASCSSSLCQCFKFIVIVSVLHVHRHRVNASCSSSLCQCFKFNVIAVSCQRFKFNIIVSTVRCNSRFVEKGINASSSMSLCQRFKFTDKAVLLLRCQRFKFYVIIVLLYWASTLQVQHHDYFRHFCACIIMTSASQTSKTLLPLLAAICVIDFREKCQDLNKRCALHTHSDYVFFRHHTVNSVAQEYTRLSQFSVE